MRDFLDTQETANDYLECAMEDLLTIQNHPNDDVGKSCARRLRRLASMIERGIVPTDRPSLKIIPA